MYELLFPSFSSFVCLFVCSFVDSLVELFRSKRKTTHTLERRVSAEFRGNLSSQSSTINFLTRWRTHQIISRVKYLFIGLWKENIYVFVRMYAFLLFQESFDVAARHTTSQIKRANGMWICVNMYVWTESIWKHAIEVFSSRSHSTFWIITGITASISYSQRFYLNWLWEWAKRM